MNDTTAQQGITASRLLIGIVLLALLLAGGALLWRQTHAPASPNAPSTPQSSTLPTPPDPTEGGRYVVIKEWGIRVPLPPDLRGQVEYVIDASSDTRQRAWFGVQQVTEMIPTCSLARGTADSKGVGVYITRTDTKVPEGDVAAYSAANIRLNDWLYSVGRVKYSEQCAPHEQSQQEVADISRELAVQFVDIETIK